MPTSKFLECNYKIARQFYSKYLGDATQNKTLTDLVKGTIRAFKDLVKPFMIPFWICSGTLLGWCRQCDVIPYISDIDVSAWARDIDDSFHEAARRKRNNLTLKQVYGFPSESYQYSFDYSGFRSDFFFTYKGYNTYWYSGHIEYMKAFFLYNFPKFTLCSGELVGEKVLIPCNAEKITAAEYGRNWMVPVKKWHFDSSPYNLGPLLYWSNQVVNRAYVEY